MSRWAPSCSAPCSQAPAAYAGAHRFACARQSSVPVCGSLHHCGGGQRLAADLMPCRQHAARLRRPSRTTARRAARASDARPGERVWAARGECVADRAAAHALRRAARFPTGADREPLLAALSQDRRVKLAQPLQTFATRTAGLQRSVCRACSADSQQMDVADAHPWSRGEGVKVAIIDTGADIRAPGFARQHRRRRQFRGRRRRAIPQRSARHGNGRRDRRGRQ